MTFEGFFSSKPTVRILKSLRAERRKHKVARVACSPLIWSPGGRSPQPPALQARSDTPRETRQGSRRRWPSGLL